MTDPYYDQDLMLDWVRGKKTRIPAPLSVRSRWYRKVICHLLKEVISCPGGCILSIGAGTGATEVDLTRAGFSVTASDIDKGSRTHCERLGLSTITLDVTRPQMPDARYDALYMDGVLGHLTADADWTAIWRNLASLDSDYLLLSNDLADDDITPNHTVFGEPDAIFYRPVAGFFGNSAIQSGLWFVKRSDVLRYHRPGRGIRRRELLMFRRVTDERTDDIRSR
ncbi:MULTISPECIES: class I SAM-dependent methyltransferase [unclassified Sulfitobacter]|uniref:class I SAM-dependent methyltransferase n=1 Tax=unclassified Sulfitobacter TaxID=196795 RepID=UPI000D155173|nr:MULTISPECIES: class I SAM-dependent methyltransferase [unclassified Sulfitobacter]ULO22220.1 class I SAM-dependent methyltransferase [Sulfitobacter sp. CB2047]